MIDAYYLITLPVCRCWRWWRVSLADWWPLTMWSVPSSSSHLIWNTSTCHSCALNQHLNIFYLVAMKLIIFSEKFYLCANYQKNLCYMNANAATKLGVGVQYLKCRRKLKSTGLVALLATWQLWQSAATTLRVTTTRSTLVRGQAMTSHWAPTLVHLLRTMSRDRNILLKRAEISLFIIKKRLRAQERANCK